MGSEGIWGPVWDGGLEVNSGSILGHIWVPYLAISREPHHMARYCLHLAVGRALYLNILNTGVRDGLGLGTGIAPPRTHPATIPRVHPSPCTMLHATATGTAAAGRIWPWGSNPSVNSL